MKNKIIITVSIILLFCLRTVNTAYLHNIARQKEWTKVFNIDKTRLIDKGENVYFKLIPGYFLVLESGKGDKKRKLVISVLDETRVIDGVTTRVVEERETKNGELVEISKNYFAIDNVTKDIFYFGEDVDIYAHGKIVSHKGSWHSGENGAKFGLMMPGKVLVGAKYYQEIAEGVAMDRSEIISVNETVKTPIGTFTNCVKIKETTPLEPMVKDFKIYAPGIGLVKDGDLILVEYGYK